MQQYTYSVTDLDQFESPSIEVDLDINTVNEFSQRLARGVIKDMPDLEHKGMCLVVYDGKGKPISITPLGTPPE
jgi:hypothetical protein